MKKYLSIVILLLFSVYVSQAQIVKVSVGIKGTGVLSMYNTDPAPEGMFINAGGGAFLGLRIANFIGIQGDFMYTVQGANYQLKNATVQLTHNYFQIPLAFQLWLGKSFILEFGYQQSILSSATYMESGITIHSEEDQGAFKYYGSLFGGVTINMGKVVFLSARYTMGSKEGSYFMNGTPYPINTAQVSLGFRLFNSKKRAF